MITIPLSEAVVYDMLAIAVIKSYRSDDPLVDAARVSLAGELIDQVGYHRHCDVVASFEYAELKRINEEVFVRVDELKTRGEQPGDALYIDSRNYQRFLAKQALQQRWFPEEPLMEQKLGYGEAAVGGSAS